MPRPLLLLAVLAPGSASAQDLVLQAFTGPTTPLPGDPALFTVTVHNAGSAPAPAARVDVRSSADAAWSADDLPLCAQDLGGFGARDTRQITLNTCPWPAAATRPWVVARVEVQLPAVDANPADNVAAYPLAAAPADVDLAPSDVQVQPDRAAPGAVLAVTYALTDHGTTGAPATLTEARWSVDGVWDVGDATICTGSVPAGVTGPLALSGCQVPAGATPGTTGRVLVKADALDAVAERDETNNVAAALVIVDAPPAPDDVDLALESLSAPATAAPGEALTVHWQVRNRGADRSETVSLAVRLSPDATYDAADPLLCDGGVGQLGPGAAASGSVPRCIVPAGTAAPASAWLVARVDDGDVHAEPDEDDNVVAVPLQLTVAEIPDLPNLAVTLPDPPPVPPGARFDLAYAVQNHGAAPSGATSVEAWRSDDDRIDLHDDLLCDGTLPPVAAGADAARTLTGCQLLPSVEPGEHRLLLRVDPADVVAEADEADNTAAAVLLITAAPVDSDAPPLARDTGPTDPPPHHDAPVTLGCACDHTGAGGVGVVIAGLLAAGRRRR